MSLSSVIRVVDSHRRSSHRNTVNVNGARQRSYMNISSHYEVSLCWLTSYHVLFDQYDGPIIFMHSSLNLITDKNTLDYFAILEFLLLLVSITEKYTLVLWFIKTRYTRGMRANNRENCQQYCGKIYKDQFQSATIELQSFGKSWTNWIGRKLLYNVTNK